VLESVFVFPPETSRQLRVSALLKVVCQTPQVVVDVCCLSHLAVVPQLGLLALDSNLLLPLLRQAQDVGHLRKA
jgi:hypothetical protein